MAQLGIRTVLCAIAAVSTIASPSSALSVAEFYNGRTISLIVGSGAGGGYDLSGRLIARHLGRFVPGKPAIVVRNMPGASSNVAALHVFNVAARDGTVLGMFQPTFVIEKINDRTLKFEPEQFTWIGRIDQSILVGVVWHTSPVQSMADAREKEAVLSAIGAAGTAATVPWALNRLIGTRFKVVLGYQSSPDTGLAMERGEVNGTGSTSWDYLETKRDWLEQRKITVLYAIALSRYHRIPGVPTIAEFAVDDRDRKVLELISTGSTIGRAVIGPPGLPADRTSALLQAFDAMVKDAEVLADAKQRNLGVDPSTGAELQRMVADVAAAPAEIIARMQAVTRQP